MEDGEGYGAAVISQGGLENVGVEPAVEILVAYPDQTVNSYQYAGHYVNKQGVFAEDFEEIRALSPFF